MSIEAPLPMEGKHIAVESRKPIVIGRVPNRRRFSKRMNRPEEVQRTDCSFDMRKKNLGVPQYLSQFIPTLRIILSHELLINPGMRDRWGFPFFDLGQDFVEEGSFHRTDYIHFDDPCDNVYVVSDKDPTVFYIQSYVIPAKITHSKGKILNQVALEQSREASAWQPEPYEIVKFDEHTAHRSAQTLTSGQRTVLRVFF